MSQHRQLKGARERALLERRDRKREKKQAARRAKEENRSQQTPPVAEPTPDDRPL
jgi:hypothetical protein